MNARIPLYFDRALKAEWIDYSLDQFARQPDPAAHRETLRAYLQEEIRSAATLRKTITQLQRYAGPLATLSPERLLTVHAEMGRRAPADRAALRLRLLREANPFFDACVGAIERLDTLGVDGIPARDLYERLTAQYGARGGLTRAVRAALETLAHLRIVENRAGRWYVRDRSLLG